MGNRARPRSDDAAQRAKLHYQPLSAARTAHARLSRCGSSVVSIGAMIRTSLFLSSVLLAAAACGGANKPTGPAPVVVTDPPPAADGAAAAPKIKTEGPNVTPEGVVFNFKSEGKKNIYLAGNFNNWTPSDEKFLLKDDDGDGIWSITVKLAPGTYQYKYVIDGTKWTQDPYGPAEAPDGFGGRNSQFEVK